MVVLCDKNLYRAGKGARNLVIQSCKVPVRSKRPPLCFGGSVNMNVTAEQRNKNNTCNIKLNKPKHLLRSVGILGTAKFGVYVVW